MSSNVFIGERVLGNAFLRPTHGAGRGRLEGRFGLKKFSQLACGIKISQC